MREIWKTIPGYGGFYEVSNIGRVRSWKNGSYGRRDEPKMLKPGMHSKGYRMVVLSKDGMMTTKSVHRLVMAVFVGESDLQVNHINGDKTDNRLENLEYVTSRENLIHARDELDSFGTQVLSRAQAEEVIGLLAEGKLEQREIGEEYGVTKYAISLIWTGTTWPELPRPWPAGTNYKTWRYAQRRQTS